MFFLKLSFSMTSLLITRTNNIWNSSFFHTDPESWTSLLCGPQSEKVPDFSFSSLKPAVVRSKSAAFTHQSGSRQTPGSSSGLQPSQADGQTQVLTSESERTEPFLDQDCGPAASILHVS